MSLAPGVELRSIGSPLFGNAARLLERARVQVQEIAQDEIAAVRTVADAYAVQNCGLALRVARGEQPCGLKLGFTSRAKMQQMGVHELIAGQLTDAMRVEDGGSVSRCRFIHPRIEPEIAFRLARELNGPLAPGELVRHVDAVAPAMEIIDSRFRDFRFDLAAVIADNASAAAFVTGAWQIPATRIDNLGLCMQVGQRPPVCGSTAAILGNPWRTLALAAGLAARHGLTIPAGAVVLAGAATAAEALPARGVVLMNMAGLGRVQVCVTDLATESDSATGDISA